ncbi:MAG: hypothetical protein AAB870_01465, partial [Patescibacteria group bacterium]
STWVRINTGRKNEKTGEDIYRFKLSRNGGINIPSLMAKYKLSDEAVVQARETRRQEQQEKKQS